MLQELYEKFASDLTDGTVVVLKQPTVLLMHNKSEPYVLITGNTLIAMYVMKPEENQWEARKVHVQEITVSHVLQEIVSVKKRAVTKQNVSSVRNFICDTSSALNEQLDVWNNEDADIFDSYVSSYEINEELLLNKSGVSRNRNVPNHQDGYNKKSVFEKGNKLDDVRVETEISKTIGCDFNKTTTNDFGVNKPNEVTSKKFNFKSVKGKLNGSFAAKPLLRSSASDSAPISTIRPRFSIFDESIQLDLNLDDFIDDLKVPECKLNSEVMQSHRFTRKCESMTGREINLVTTVSDSTDSALKKVDPAEEANFTEKILHKCSYKNDAVSHMRDDEQPPLKKFKMSTDETELLSNRKFTSNRVQAKDETPIQTSGLGFFDVDVNIDFNTSQIHTSTVAKSQLMESVFSDMDTDLFFGEF